MVILPIGKFHQGDVSNPLPRKGTETAPVATTGAEDKKKPFNGVSNPLPRKGTETKI